MFTAVRTRYPFEEAVTQITDAIRAGDLGVADRLPSERVLAQQMDISRPTLREAVKVLVDSGVLEVRPGATGGIFVRSDIIPRRLNSDGWRLRVGEVTDVLEARRVVQSRIAQFACLRATADDLAALAQTLELLRASVNNRTRFMQLDERFQIALARAAHNNVLLAQMKGILRQVRIARDSALREQQPEETLWAVGSLGRIYQAVASRDLDLIDREMDEHLSYLENIWAEEIGQSQARPEPPSLRPAAPVPSTAVPSTAVPSSAAVTPVVDR